MRVISQLGYIISGLIRQTVSANISCVMALMVKRLN